MAKRAGKKLGSLPESKDEFWDGAEVNLASYSDKKCAHAFKKKGREIVCKNCGWGLFMDAQDSFKDGNLYRKGKLVI